VAIFECADSLMILGFNLCKSLVPTLVEILILHEVSLLYFFPFAGLIIDELLSSASEVLDLELFNSILGHLCFHILALHFALFAMFLEDSTT
jgi:hypothetical protein